MEALYRRADLNCRPPQADMNPFTQIKKPPIYGGFVPESRLELPTFGL